MDDAGQHSHRNGDITDRDQNGSHRREHASGGVVFLMIESQRLKHTPKAVIKMKAQGNHGQDIEEGHRFDLKTKDHIGVDIMGTKMRMDRTEGEMQEMINNVKTEKQTAPH